jgi:hypothetical protein
MPRLFVRLGIIAIVAGLIASLTFTGSARAQEGTPEAMGLAPAPEECTLTPRTLDEIQAIAGTPAPEGAGETVSAERDASPEAFTLPTGESADDETVAAITEAVRQLMACHNAGHYLAGFGGVSESFLRSQVGLSLFDEDFIAAISSEPVAHPEESHTQLHGVRTVIVLDDGRIGALVDYVSPLPQPEGIDGFETDFWIFTDVDGQWLLDESVENVERQHGPEGIATPDAMS